MGRLGLFVRPAVASSHYFIDVSNRVAQACRHLLGEPPKNLSSPAEFVAGTLEVVQIFPVCVVVHGQWSAAAYRCRLSLPCTSLRQVPLKNM